MENRSLVVILLDIDRFKEVNDTLGPSIGDALLQGVANRLVRRLKNIEMVARIGGDEFVVLQLTDKPATTSAVLAKKIQTILSTSFDIDDHQIVVGTSIGIAIGPGDGDDPDQLLKSADLALTRAKSDGPGTSRFFEREMDQNMQARHKLERDLRSALQHGELELYYQPQLNLERGHISGFEALLRWNHPERGLVLPGEFIPIAEETGLIVPMGEWTLRQACADAVKWPKGIKVAVNLSATQFRSGNVRHAVIAALGASRLLPQMLELEVTESVLLQDSDGVAETLSKLHDIGVGIALDDFGTGYSSLSYLKRFHFDKIKIDQIFIKELGEQADSSLAILRSIIALGTSLGIATTAEGVETKEQLERMRKEGCTEVQGYYISVPRPRVRHCGNAAIRQTGARPSSAAPADCAKAILTLERSCGTTARRRRLRSTINGVPGSVPGQPSDGDDRMQKEVAPPGRVQRLRGGMPILFGLASLLAFYIYGGAWLADPTQLAVRALLFVWLLATILVCIFAVVQHAEILADLLGEPQGTLVLTISVVVIEMALIVTVMLEGVSDPTLARDTMFAVIMIMMNGMVGLSLLAGGLRHVQQEYNLDGARAYLAVIIPLTAVVLILPNLTKSTDDGSLSFWQATFFSIATIMLYVIFLGLQAMRHRGFFQEPGSEPQDHDPQPPGADPDYRRRAIAIHAGLLFVTMVPIVGLAQYLAVMVEHGIHTLGVPSAVGGILIAALIFAPESISALEAAVANKLQRSINLCLGSALSTVALTVPIVLIIGLATGQSITLGLENDNALVLALTLLVSMLTFTGGRTNVLQGAVHLLLFFTYIVLIFNP